jgi:hypothetical protein
VCRILLFARAFSHAFDFFDCSTNLLIYGPGGYKVGIDAEKVPFAPFESNSALSPLLFVVQRLCGDRNAYATRAVGPVCHLSDYNGCIELVD